MPTVTLTTTGAGTWAVPADCPTGTVVTVETWGAGSGGTGRVSSTFGAAGAGGAYASSSYVITPQDVASGVPYTVGSGTTGLSGANPAAGGNSTWSTNNLNLIPTTVTTTAVTGSPGSYPTNWVDFSWTGFTRTILNTGIDAQTGLQYLDVNYTVTAANNTGGGGSIYFCSTGSGPGYGTGMVPVTGGGTYTASVYAAVIGGSLTNITGVALQGSDENSAFTQLGQIFNSGVFTPTSVLTRYTATATAISSTGTPVWAFINLIVTWTTGTDINVTFRLAAPQVDTGSSATFFKSTPGYALAVGGGAAAGDHRRRWRDNGCVYWFNQVCWWIRCSVQFVWVRWWWISRQEWCRQYRNDRRRWRIRRCLGRRRRWCRQDQFPRQCRHIQRRGRRWRWWPDDSGRNRRCWWRSRWWRRRGCRCYGHRRHWSEGSN